MIICRFSLFFPFYIVFDLDIPNIYKLSRHLITDPANHLYHSPSLSQQKIVRKLRSLMCGKKTFHIHPLRIKTIGWRTHSTLKLYRLTEIVVFFEFIQLSPLDRTHSTILQRQIVINADIKKDSCKQTKDPTWKKTIDQWRSVQCWLQLFSPNLSNTHAYTQSERSLFISIRKYVKKTCVFFSVVYICISHFLNGYSSVGVLKYFSSLF